MRAERARPHAAAVPLLIMDDASPDDRSVKLLAELDQAGVLAHRVHSCATRENHGFVRTVNEALRIW